VGTLPCDCLSVRQLNTEGTEIPYLESIPEFKRSCWMFGVFLSAILTIIGHGNRWRLHRLVTSWSPFETIIRLFLYLHEVKSTCLSCNATVCILYSSSPTFHHNNSRIIVWNLCILLLSVTPNATFHYLSDGCAIAWRLFLTFDQHGKFTTMLWWYLNNVRNRVILGLSTKHGIVL
jgi:hypothetical protein